MFSRVKSRVKNALYRRAPAFFKAKPASAPPQQAVDSAERAVERDNQLSGWFNQETGELVAGFGGGADDVVLDVGCGETPISLHLVSRVAKTILVDLVPETIAAAEINLKRVGAKDYRVIVGDCDPLPLDDGTVTRIIAAEVLEHVADPTRFMAELVRVGRPGALYFISVPDSSTENLQMPFAAPAHWLPPNHIRIFDREQFEKLISDAGLIVERKFVYGFYWTMWWCFFWVCKQDLAPPWHPLLESWKRTWGLLLSTEQGPQIKDALDKALPKSQAIIARKP